MFSNARCRRQNFDSLRSRSALARCRLRRETRAPAPTCALPKPGEVREVLFLDSVFDTGARVLRAAFRLDGDTLFEFITQRHHFAGLK